MSTHQLHTLHERSFESNRFVYPVLSRRSRGISIGVNLNPDKVCNFDCIYCQVDRTRQSETRFVEMDGLLAELRGVLQLVTSGEIYATDKFKNIPTEHRLCRGQAVGGIRLGEYGVHHQRQYVSSRACTACAGDSRCQPG